MTEAETRIGQFLAHLSLARRLSANTVDAYRRDLSRLSAAIGDAPLAETSASFVRRLVAADKKAHPASLARRLAAWRSFFDYLVAVKAAPRNPARAVSPPKKPATLPKALTPDEVAAFLAACDGEEWIARRDKALMELFYSSALRLSELTGLNVNDVNLPGGVVYVLRGKGGRGRIAPVGGRAREAIRAWLPHRGALLEGRRAESALFVGQKRRRLSPRAAQQRIRLHARRAGLPVAVSPHMLRHSCASHFLQSSGDLRATQELLGHRDIATTQIYTRLDFQHLAAAYDRAHPRARRGKKLGEG